MWPNANPAPSTGGKPETASREQIARFDATGSQHRDSVRLPADWRQARLARGTYPYRTAKHSCSFFSSYIERGHLRARVRCLNHRPQNHIQAHVARGAVAAVGLPDFKAGACAQLCQLRQTELMGVAQAAAAALPVK